MNQDATHYDQACLQRLLEDALPEPLTNKIAEHLGHCAACRSELEALAAAPQWWSQACSGVKEILADPAAYMSSHSNVQEAAEASTAAGNDESFSTDFAVDFLEPSDNAAMLGKLGEYEILEVIGRGGMGVVLKGYQSELHRYVAVKVLAPHLAQSAAARKRFSREAQATAAVVHPHVMAIHAVAANAKLPYLVMPFVACESLQQRLDRLGPLDIRDVLRIGLQAASGLAAAHAQGLVHRDIKPANILLETSVDRVMLNDFGLARAVDDATLTRTGIIAGTPQYMSPEQANGDAVDHRSDLFSLGSVLYAMCTARAPFRAETTFGVLRRIRETQPRPIREVNADIPDWLEWITAKLHAKVPEDRIASANEVAILLEQCLAHVQQPTTVGLPEACQACRPVVVSQEELTLVGTHPRLPIGSQSTSPGMSHLWQSKRLQLWLSAVLILTLGVILYPVFARPLTLIPDENVEESHPTIESPLTDPLLEWDATQSELDAAAEMIDVLDANAQHDLQSN
jgi:serine/threonine protein kinase